MPTTKGDPVALVLPSLEGLNEADLREELITPLLHQLGYRSGTRAAIIRELSLRYPRIFLGRKDLSRDPPLRGRADYVLEVDGRIRWTIEAKAPGCPISLDDVEQAYSYAYHPEVRAVLFCLINGHELRLYQTVQGPNAPPIAALSGAEVLTADSSLANVLSPASLLRDHPTMEPDVHEPIGPGLRSVVRVLSGFAQFTECTPRLPLVAEMVLFFNGGAIERDEAGQLVMYLEARSPFRSANDFNERLGLSRLELCSRDHVLSVDPAAPTVFTLRMSITLPAGEAMPNLLGGDPAILLHNIGVTSTTVGRAVLQGSRLVGVFEQYYEYRDLPQVGDTLSVSALGQCEIMLG